jgi:hypothetical protein
MNLMSNICQYGYVFILFTSCTVTNNLYVNDPVPVSKGKVELYGGLGSGFMPKIDSTSLNGDIRFSNNLSVAPNLCIGGRFGLGQQTDLRFAVHFPYIISGFGLKAGVQQSLFKPWTKFNVALGVDAGFVVAKDTLNLGNTAIALDPDTRGAINADFYLPVSYSFSNHSRIIITPRISANTMYIKKNTAEKKGLKKYKPFYPALSLGSRINRLYLEATALYVDNKILPAFGIIYFFDTDSDKEL